METDIKAASYVTEADILHVGEDAYFESRGVKRSSPDFIKEDTELLMHDQQPGSDSDDEFVSNNNPQPHS